MKKLLLLLLLVQCWTCFGQSNPASAFVFSGGTWTPQTTTAVGGTAFPPPPVSLYCFNSGTGLWSGCPPASSGGGGTVTSVGLTVPSWLTVTGSPVTTSGTLAVSPTAAQTSHQVIGTCGTATTFAPCALVAGDLPAPFNAALPNPNLSLLYNNSGAFGAATQGQISTQIGGNPGTTFIGDSISWGAGSTPVISVSQPNINGFAPLVANAVGGPYYNYSNSGDQCADQNFNVVFRTLNPVGNFLDSVMISELGTNDITRYTTTTNQQNIFNRCILANVSWGSIPFANKKFGQNGTLAGGFAADATATVLQGGLGALSTTSAATATYTISTPVANGPIYFWYLIKDSNGGTFTVSVDGTNQTDTLGTGTTTWNAAGDGGSLISTTLGTTSMVAGVRFATTGAANSSHTVIVTVTSTTSASNIVEVYGVGTAPLVSVSNPVVVAVSPNPQNNANTALVATYSGFVSTNVATVAGDGLNAYFADTGSALLNIATAVTLPYTLTTTTQAIPGWVSDVGVSYAGQPGSALTLVGSSPAAGQYSVSAGAYTINTADRNRPLLISATVNCGSNSVSTLATNCYSDGLIHPNNEGHAVMKTVILATIPATHTNGALGAYRPTPLVTSGASLLPTNPSQFWSPNPLNANGSTTWNPGVNLVYLNGASYGVNYQALTGITNYFPNTGGTIAWSLCPTVAGAGKQAPGIPPTSASCYMTVASNGVITTTVSTVVPRLTINGAGYSNTLALPTGALAGGACSSAVSYAPGGSQVATTSTIIWNPNADPTGVTGYGAGGLVIWVYPTTGSINAKVCNPTALSITPGALTINIKAVL
jgi:hypothetical protein